MSLRRHILAAVLLAAVSGRAELAYCLFDLECPEQAAVAVSPTAEELDGFVWRSDGTKMLFVRDSALGGDIWMGVYEVTEAQAVTLGWKSAASAPNAALGLTGGRFPEVPAGQPSLAFPTAEQWLAYAGTPAKPCNLQGGRQKSYYGAVSPAEWVGQADQGVRNAHGVADAWGNVAERCADGYFYGGYAGISTDDGYEVYSANPSLRLAASQIAGTADNAPCQGARLVYTPPEQLAYSVTVTLDGVSVASQTETAEAAVSTPWPDPGAGRRLLSRTVVPEGLTVEDAERAAAFTMPRQAVTLAYVSAATATFSASVSGKGTASAERVPSLEGLEALADNEAFAGERVRFSAEPAEHWALVRWEDAEGAPIAAAGASTSWEAVAAATAMDCTAVFAQPVYTLDVTLDGVSAAGYPQEVTLGDPVTVDAPAPAAWHRLTEVASTSVAVAPALSGRTTFAMPAEHVTLAYRSSPYATLRVTGGTADDSQPFLGQTVILSATVGRYQIFTGWSGAAEGASAEMAFTVPADAAPGTAYAFTASTADCPRVLVYGGTVRGGMALGEGHYAEGSTLALTAEPPEGYRFSGSWAATLDGEAAEPVTNGTVAVTAALRGHVLALTAQFELDESSEGENPLVTHLGAGTGETTYAPFGWTADEVASRTVLGNVFRLHAVQPAGAYALLKPADGSIAYRGNVDNALAENQTTLLPLKRVGPVAGSHYPTGETFYLGLYETTEAQAEALRCAVSGNEADAQRLADKDPYVATAAELDTVIAQAASRFGLPVANPTVAQIEAVTQSGLPASEEYNGCGVFNEGTSVRAPYGDGYVDAQRRVAVSRITEAMVYCVGGTSYRHAAVGSKSPDPYGFYDLWGNAQEYLADGHFYGGYGGSQYLYHCSLNPLFRDAGNAYVPQRGAVRPAIPVAGAVNVTLENAGETLGPFPVVSGQSVRLAPQVRPGYAFTGWTASRGALTVADDGYAVAANVSEDVTFTAGYAPRERVALAYDGCVGAAEGFPGQTLPVYAAKASGAALLSLEVSPAGAAEVDLASGAITLSDTASGTVTVTARYAVPASGYRLRLR